MLRSLKGKIRSAMPVTVVAAYRRMRFGLRGPSWYRHRAVIARRYLTGAGLEIGALHMPTPLVDGATAAYADRLPDDELRQRYAHHLRVGWKLVTVTVVDDAQCLATVADDSYDFLVAHHVIEHMEEPIGAVSNWLRVVRPGGMVMIGVPHRERTFDYRRPGTSVEHTARDYREGPEWSRLEHHREFAQLVLEIPAGEMESRLPHLMRDAAGVHFHAWTTDEFQAMLEHARGELSLPMEVVEVSEADGAHEFLAVLRRLKVGGS